MTTTRTALDTGREVLGVFRGRQISFLAASVAYYAFVSLFPLLLLALAAATLVGGETLTRQVVGLAEGALTPSGQEDLATALTDGAGRGGATLVSVVVFLWSGLKVFRALDTAFSIVYGSETRSSLAGQVVEALVAFLAIVIAVELVLVVGALVPRVSGVPFLDVASVLLALPALALVFLPLYYFFPDAEVTLREVVPGALFAAVGWTILQGLFQVYAANAGSYAVYGVIGGVLLLVTWLYFGSLVLLLGAVVNVVIADRDVREQSIQAVDERIPLQRGVQGMNDEREEAAPDIAELERELRSLQTELDRFETDVEERTVQKEEVKSELKAYVRRRVRRGHARGWGPYLVLLYGTAMTLGAFYLLEGGWSILAMVVVWLSTLGLYALMLIVGFGINALGLPGRLGDRVRSWRS